MDQIKGATECKEINQIKSAVVCIEESVQMFSKEFDSLLDIVCDGATATTKPDVDPEKQPPVENRIAPRLFKANRNLQEIIKRLVSLNARLKDELGDIKIV